MALEALEAENHVIGSMLIDPSCVPVVAEKLTVDDFIGAANQALFQATMALYRKGAVIDPVTIKEAAARAGESVDNGYLLQLMEVVLTAANVEEYARVVRETSMRRSLRTLAASLDEQAGGMDDPRETIAFASRELERIEAQDTANELATTSDMLVTFLDHRDQVDRGTGGAYVQTGFRGLDHMLGGGLLNSGLYVLAARPGMGKTSLAINIADNIAATGPVLFVSLEMDLEQIAAKRLARLVGIPSDTLLMGQLSDEEYSKMADGAMELEKLPMVLNRKPWATVQDISNMARKVKGLRCIVLDYIGKVSPGGKGKQSRYEYMTEISGDLKTLARTFKVPVLALAQLNRENAQRKDRRPQLTDLRDTGAIEQDADGVIFLHRPDYYMAKDGAGLKPWEPTPVEVILEKNRHSGTGKCDMAFFMAMCRMVPAQGIAGG